MRVSSFPLLPNTGRSGAPSRREMGHPRSGSLREVKDESQNLHPTKIGPSTALGASYEWGSTYIQVAIESSGKSKGMRSNAPGSRRVE